MLFIIHVRHILYNCPTLSQTLTKIKKSFRLSADVVQKIEDSDNESAFVEKAVRKVTTNEIKEPDLPKGEVVRIIKWLKL